VPKTYEEIHNAVHAELSAITAIRQLDAAGNVTNVLNYIPNDIHTSPLIYMRNTEDTVESALAVVYTFEGRLAVIRQVSEGAQLIFNGLISSLRSTFSLGADLSGVITSGGVRRFYGRSDTVVMPPDSGKVYRVYDFEIDIVDKS
jgi:prophage DNA circulation protein